MNPNLLRRGAIYRATYLTWKTNPRPTVFILYAGPSKVHCLSLNAPGVTALDAANFATFIKKMKSIAGVENWGGRVLYRTLRQYFPLIIQKCYRTLITGNISAYTIVSTGIIPPSSLTPLDKSHTNNALYQDALRNPVIKRIVTLSSTQYNPPPKAPLYQPPVIKKENNQPPVDKIKLDEIKENEKQNVNAATNKPQPASGGKDDDRYFSVYDEGNK